MIKGLEEADFDPITHTVIQNSNLRNYLLLAVFLLKIPFLGYIIKLQPFEIAF